MITDEQNFQMKFACDARGLQEARTFYEYMNHPAVGWLSDSADRSTSSVLGQGADILCDMCDYDSSSRRIFVGNGGYDELLGGMPVFVVV